MSFADTLFICFAALLLFGPKKLPEIARQVGKVLNQFRRASNEFRSQIESEISQLDREHARAEREKVAKEAVVNKLNDPPPVMLPLEAPFGTVEANSADSPEAAKAPNV